MKKNNKSNSRTAQSKEKRRGTPNPADAGLTPAENDALYLVTNRQKNGFIISTGMIAQDWNKHRVYTRRVLKRLIAKGFIENYDNFFYRITNPKTKEST